MCKSILFRIGGDSDISDRGEQYAMALSYFFNHQVGFVSKPKMLEADFAKIFCPQTIPGLRVWTSWLKRTIQTSAHISAPQVEYHQGNLKFSKS